MSRRYIVTRAIVRAVFYTTALACAVAGFLGFAAALARFIP